MNTIQGNLANSFALPKLYAGPTVYKNKIWDSPLTKKFISAKWPYELYKGSILQDFLSVLFSTLK